MFIIRGGSPWIAIRKFSTILTFRSVGVKHLPSVACRGDCAKHLSTSVACSGIGVKHLKDSDLKPKQAGINKGHKGLVQYYQSLCAWQSQHQVTDLLEASIVYHEPADPGGLVVLSKPYGLPARPLEDCPFSLTTSLAPLAQRLNLPKLTLIRCAERFTSGITLLGTSEDTVARYKMCMGRLQTSRSLGSAYLCLVKGHSGLNITESVDLVEEECNHINKPLVGSKHKEPVISRALLSRHKAHKSGVKRIHFHCATLAKSGLVEASLVQVEPSNTGNHALSVYMSDLGHPLLGDQMYDYRCRGLFGHKVKLGPAHSVPDRSQALAQPLMQLLGLAKGEAWKVPKMVHYHRLLLPDWGGKGKNLTVFAPPPPHFEQTCKVLQVQLDYKKVAEEDIVTHWQAQVKKKSKALEVIEEKTEQSDLHQNLDALDAVKKPPLLVIKPKVVQKRKRIFRPETEGRSF